MASLALHLKSHHHKNPQAILKSAPTLTFSHLFSSSSSSDNNGGDASKPPKFSSYFSDIKSRLKQQQQPQQPQNQQHQSMRSQGSSNPPKIASLDEIRKNLSEFRQRSSVPVPGSPSTPDSQQPTLLQDLYKKNMVASNPNANTNLNAIKENARKGTLSFEAIRESLRQLRATQGDKPKTGSDHLSLNKYKDSFKLRPAMAEGGGGASKVYGGSPEGLPVSVFGREMNEREKKKKAEEGKESTEDEFAKSELIRMYSHAELGEKLRELRPEATKKGEKESGFSLAELNERLKKLREIEEKQQVARGGGISFGELRSSLQQIRLSQEHARGPEYPRVDILARLDGTQTLMLSPPKEHLVEKYFHPDNMSSEEKLKLELKRVRDEFKMHESDCGSARVQGYMSPWKVPLFRVVAVRGGMDKHSRKGLLAKVQQRKKLLKYLRRTDWDSYCLVLSKLGLRDNPDYRN
ncbi:hypothetical protein Cgig2_007790 [Carnegiea gigantea]|uniref:30S ribosomal protein S15, chloroplastic n=1 Tax=Carnegiea gigantea TaxID=171969 RepID=A0A9Q1GYG3_9CARY|nr:hypothetical protein Cgig2_007790 [Carnegiea gigantea]